MIYSLINTSTSVSVLTLLVVAKHYLDIPGSSSPVDNAGDNATLVSPAVRSMAQSYV